MCHSKMGTRHKNNKLQCNAKLSKIKVYFYDFLTAWGVFKF